MKLPNGDGAVIDDRKLWGYVLNPNHPHGRSPAFLFQRLLNIDLSNWRVLRDELLRAARDEEGMWVSARPKASTFVAGGQAQRDPRKERRTKIRP